MQDLTDEVEVSTAHLIKALRLAYRVKIIDYKRQGLFAQRGGMKLIRPLNHFKRDM